MKYIQLLCVSVFLACISIQGFANATMLGSDSDEHGCKTSAGYSWSDDSQQCVRTWMEDEEQLRKDAMETYPTFDAMIEAHPTCKVASDGCNSVGVVNGVQGPMTEMSCEDIYGENATEAWSCLDSQLEDKRIGFLSDNDQNQYTAFQDHLGDTVSEKILDAVNKFGNKILIKESYNIDNSIKVVASAISAFNTAIDRIIMKYPADASMSTNDTQTYYILTVAKFEIQIMKHRWENSISTNTELPEDFIPGAVYDLTVKECKEKGGTMIQDGNGIYFCDMQ